MNAAKTELNHVRLASTNVNLSTLRSIYQRRLLALGASVAFSIAKATTPAQKPKGHLLQR